MPTDEAPIELRDQRTWFERLKSGYLLRGGPAGGDRSRRGGGALALGWLRRTHIPPCGRRCVPPRGASAGAPRPPEVRCTWSLATAEGFRGRPGAPNLHFDPGEAPAWWIGGVRPAYRPLSRRSTLIVKVPSSASTGCTISPGPTKFPSTAANRRVPRILPSSRSTHSTTVL